MPQGFWYLSLAGAAVIWTYAVFFLRDPVIILGQSTGFLIYTRNLILIRRKRAAQDEASP